jgi:hypothetical protein
VEPLAMRAPRRGVSKNGSPGRFTYRAKAKGKGCDKRDWPGRCCREGGIGWKLDSEPRKSPRTSDQAEAERRATNMLWSALSYRQSPCSFHIVQCCISSVMSRLRTVTAQRR